MWLKSKGYANEVDLYNMMYITSVFLKKRGKVLPLDFNPYTKGMISFGVEKALWRLASKSGNPQLEQSQTDTGDMNKELKNYFGRLFDDLLVVVEKIKPGESREYALAARALEHLTDGKLSSESLYEYSRQIGVRDEIIEEMQSLLG
jgi:hypothetical protein